VKQLSHNRLRRKGKGRYVFEAHFCWIILLTLSQEKFVVGRMKRIKRITVASPFYEEKERLKAKIDAIWAETKLFKSKFTNE
jgi:hypothetical protein